MIISKDGFNGMKISGLILDSLSLARLEVKRLKYLSYPSSRVE
jgi:hypothetical protein